VVRLWVIEVNAELDKGSVILNKVLKVGLVEGGGVVVEGRDSGRLEDQNGHWHRDVVEASFEGQDLIIKWLVYVFLRRWTSGHFLPPDSACWPASS